MTNKKIIKFHQISVGAPSISQKEIKYVLRALKNNQLSCGPLTEKFEQLFAQAHGRKYAIFCNSGTSALQAGLHALKIKHGWKDGDEVILPALTFVASLNVILQNNLTPVLADVEPDYFGIMPSQIAVKITQRTRAIMPVHLFGMQCAMDKIVTIAQKYQLALIEDSCETMFASYQGKPAGSWSDVSCFSTYVAHLLTTGVGGLATTNDSDLALLIKSLFNHGRDGIYIGKKLQQGGAQFQEVVRRRFNFLYPGYSYRATELEGAIGLAQIERWRQIIGGHQRSAKYYLKHLAQFEKYLQLPKIRPGAGHVFMMFPIVIKTPQLIKRQELIMFLEDRGIETRYMLPLTNQPYIKQMWGNIEKQFPNANYINQHGFYIGSHQNLTQMDLEYVIEVFEEFFHKKHLPT